MDIDLSSFLLASNIQLGKKLGEGYFAEVFEGYDHDHQRKVAIKKLKDLNNLKKFEEEKEAMLKIQNHQYAIQLFKYLHDVDRGYSMIIMEFCDCNLTEIFQKNSQNFTFEQLVALSYQLLKGLLVFQEKGIIHGDLKPDNILYNQQKNIFLISDLGLSQIIENPELQQLISKQSKQQNGGNFKYMAPEVAHNIKPFTIKIDVFSLGQILLEFLLKRELSMSEFLKLKEYDLLDRIPELKQHQNYKFVEEILVKMVCHQSMQRLESITLLQKLNQFKVNEEYLKSLIFSNKNAQQIIQEASQKQLVTNTNEEVYQQLVTLPNNDDKKEPKKNQNLQQTIQLSNINLVEKKQIKSICITNENMKENLNLENYQEVKLDFNNSLSMQKNCFCIENLNIVNAIRKIQKINGITAMIVDLKKNQMSLQKAQSISNSLMKCQNLTSIKIDLDQGYFDNEEINNIMCFLRACQNFSSFEINIDNQADFFQLKKQHNLVEFTLTINNFMIDEQIHGQRISSIQNLILNQDIQTYLDICLNSESIDDEKAQIIAQSIKKYQNITQLHLDLSENSIGDKGAESISDAIQNYHNLTKLELRLKYNQIGIEGAKKISNSLKNYQNITQFVLGLTKNSIGMDGTKSISNAIQNYQNITSLGLGLGYNSIGDEGVKSISKSIKNYLKITQFKLYLVDNQIGVEGAKNIANAIRNYQNIKYFLLYLKDNSIGVEGAKNIANSIQNYQNITYLDLSFSNNQIGDEGVISISDAIKNYQKVTELSLYLSTNQISDEGAKSIANTIRNYQNIRKIILNLSNNSIGDEGVKNICNSIKSHQKITKLELYLSNNNIDKDFKKNIEKQLKGINLKVEV